MELSKCEFQKKIDFFWFDRSDEACLKIERVPTLRSRYDIYRVYCLYLSSTNTRGRSCDEKERPRRLPTRYRATPTLEPTTVFDDVKFWSEHRLPKQRFQVVTTVMCYDYGRYLKRVEQYLIRVFIRMENDEFRKGFLGILKIIHLFFSLVLYFLMKKKLYV